MNHQTVLALVSAVWVALELMVGILSRRSGSDRSALDRGSFALLWVLLVGSIY